MWGYGRLFDLEADTLDGEQLVVGQIENEATGGGLARDLAVAAAGRDGPGEVVEHIVEVGVFEGDDVGRAGSRRWL